MLPLLVLPLVTPVLLDQAAQVWRQTSVKSVTTAIEMPLRCQRTASGLQTGHSLLKHWRQSQQELTLSNTVTPYISIQFHQIKTEYLQKNLNYVLTIES